MAYTPTVANSLFDRGGTSVRQEIGVAAKELIRAIDPTFNDMFLTNMKDVPAAGNVGRDMRMHKEYFGSQTGVIRGGNLNSFESQFGAQTVGYGPKIHTQSLPAAAPRAQDGANPTPYGLTTKIYSMELNLMLTLAQMEMDALPANIQEKIVPVLRGHAKLIALYSANAFFANSSSQYRLCTLPTIISANINSTNRTITFQPVERTIHRLAVGQPVDVWQNSTTKLNKKAGGTSASETDRVVGFVSDVDPWTNTVTLSFNPNDVSADGTAIAFTAWATTGNLSAGFITYANQYGASPTAGFSGLYGWRDWAKWGGVSDGTSDRRILGANAVTDTENDYIDVSQHGEFRSGHFKDVGTLTETLLISHLQRMHSAFDPLGHYIDRLIAAEGIWLNVFDQRTAQTRVNMSRTGEVASMNALGVKDGIEIYCDGRMYKGHTSRFIESGTILGVRGANNWGIVVPPDAQGTTRGGIPDMPDRIPVNFYMGTLTGTGSIRFPILTADGAVVQACQIPSKVRMQFQPMEQIPMVVWEGVSSTYTLSDGV
jgi:hypothetical protein